MIIGGLLRTAWKLPHGSRVIALVCARTFLLAIFLIAMLSLVLLHRDQICSRRQILIGAASRISYATESFRRRDHALPSHDRHALQISSATLELARIFSG
jgi:hypothetical protein